MPNEVSRQQVKVPLAFGHITKCFANRVEPVQRRLSEVGNRSPKGVDHPLRMPTFPGLKLAAQARQKASERVGFTHELGGKFAHGCDLAKV